MKQDIRLTLAQLNPTVGNLDGNVEKIFDVWKKHDQESDLIIFPELFLTGYPPEDLALSAAFLNAIDLRIEQICEASKNYDSAILIPTIYRIDGKIHNAALVIQKEKVIHTITKKALPNYKVFDEARIFTSGPMPEPLILNGRKLGILICEDLWSAPAAQHLKSQGAEILIAVNASPYYKGKDDKRKSVFKQNIENTTLDLIYLNTIGGQDELVFDGHSFIMGNDGQIIHQAPAFEENVFSVKLSKNSELQTPAENHEYEESLLLYEALKTGLRDYVRKNGFNTVIIGLSGGIDSALTTAIAVDSLGAENVRCIMMPSEFTSEDSLEDAQQCANLLNVQYEIMPINDIVKTFEGLISDLRDTAHENTQSRIRGSILMALSNMSDALLLTTGNKSEMAVGYCTLYGDMNGGFNPLKDVYKTEVYKLAKWRNAQENVIPERIITKPPSAELKEDQTDQDSLPPYELLDAILKLLIEHDNVSWLDATPEIVELQAQCLEHTETIEKVARLLKNSEFKRYQAAPGTRVTTQAFGRDRRYPLTNHFVNKIEKQS